MLSIKSCQKMMADAGVPKMRVENFDTGWIMRNAGFWNMDKETREKIVECAKEWHKVGLLSLDVPMYKNAQNSQSFKKGN